MSKDSFLALKKKKAIQCLNENNMDEAEKYLKQVCSKSKRDAEAWYLLGLIYGRKANHAEAERHFRQVIQIAPDIPDSYVNLAVSLNVQAKHEDCIELLTGFLEQYPDDVDALVNLSVALLALNRPEPVINYAKHAVALANNNPATHEVLASAYTMLQMTEEASKHFETAIQLDDRNPKILHNYAKLTLLKNDYNHCIKLCEKALDIDPLFLKTFNTLALALISKGQVKKLLALLREAHRNYPEEFKDSGAYLFNLNYADDISPEHIFLEHRCWGDAISSQASTSARKTEHASCGSPIRIGYVSPDFRLHSVAYFLEPLLKYHDKNTFEIFCYSNVKKNDDVTTRLQSQADHWRDIYRLSDHQVIKQIQGDQIDILVDLAGHSRGNRLGVFVERPAPVQITYLGYPATTGLPAMDYRLVDENTDPVGSDNFATERLLRVPGCFICYSNTFKDEPERIERDEPVVFGSFNNLPKINSQVIAAWAEIMHQVNDSSLLLKSRAFADNHVCEDYLQMFEQHGILRGRITLMGKVNDEIEHLQCYNRMDIALDTFPYNGTTTTCEALWMGVPVICFSGDRHAARVSSSLLKAAGLDELVAEDRQGYIEKAVALAGDAGRRQQYRTRIRKQMLHSPLCDEKGFTRKIEDIYKGLCHQLEDNSAN